MDHPFILPIYQASIESLSAQPKTPTSTSLGVSLKSSGITSDKVESLNLITFRPLSSNGSLKGTPFLLYSFILDLIYNSKPTTRYSNKYSSSGTPVSEQKLAKIGKFVLEALDYLNSQLGISICNLHSGLKT